MDRLLNTSFRAWKRVANRSRRSHTILLRLVGMLRQRLLSRSFGLWRHRAFMLGAHAKFSMVHSQVLRAIVSEMATPPSQHNMMTHVIATMQTPNSLVRAFRAWKSTTQSCVRRRRQFRTTLVSWQVRQLAAAWRTWKDATLITPRVQLLIRIVHRWKQRRVAAAFDALCAAAGVSRAAGSRVRLRVTGMSRTDLAVLRRELEQELLGLQEAHDAASDCTTLHSAAIVTEVAQRLEAVQTDLAAISAQQRLGASTPLSSGSSRGMPGRPPVAGAPDGTGVAVLFGSAPRRRGRK